MCIPRPPHNWCEKAAPGASRLSPRRRCSAEIVRDRKGSVAGLPAERQLIPVKGPCTLPPRGGCDEREQGDRMRRGQSSHWQTACFLGPCWNATRKGGRRAPLVAAENEGDVAIRVFAWSPQSNNNNTRDSEAEGVQRLLSRSVTER